MHGLCQPGPGQARYGEVFDIDRLVVADQPKRCLVQVVGPRLADLPVLHRHAQPGFSPVRGTLLLARQCTLCPREVPLTRPQVARVSDQFTI
jgi:hypothetical protein